jgi:nitrogen fixation protein FixH
MRIKKKTILFLGVIIAVFLMLMMPTINIVNAEVVQNEKRIDNLNKVTNIET